MQMPHNLLLTGRPGIGKTTVIQQTIALLPPLRLQGFTTSEIRGPRGRRGFHATTLAGHEIVLAHVNLSSPYRVSKYYVDVAAFEEEIVPTLRVDQEVDLFILDEIGKMECFSAAFREAVEQLLAAPQPLLGTIARRGPTFIQEIQRRPDVELVEISMANRDRLPGQIERRLRQWLEENE
jgi:nucleoside-triphosphatase